MDGYIPGEKIDEMREAAARLAALLDEAAADIGGEFELTAERDPGGHYNVLVWRKSSGRTLFTDSFKRDASGIQPWASQSGDLGGLSVK